MYVHDRRAELLQLRNRGQGRCFDLSVQTRAVKFARNPNAQTLERLRFARFRRERLTEQTGEILALALQTGRITLIKAVHGVEQGRAVVRRARHRAGLIEG